MNCQGISPIIMKQGLQRCFDLWEQTPVTGLGQSLKMELVQGGGKKPPTIHLYIGLIYLVGLGTFLFVLYIGNNHPN